MKPRDLVRDTLEFNNSERVPRQLWELPWALQHHPRELDRIKRDFPDDIVTAPCEGFPSCEGFEVRPGDPHGNPYEPGIYIDHWNCRFTNFHRGVIGEVKQPPVTGEHWEERDGLRIPEECLTVNREAVNEFCARTDRFVLAGDWARPFERLQFIRGTEQLYIDLVLQPEELFEFMEMVHDYYCRLLTAWAETDVDGLWYMDDWGAQQSLLINPEMWKKLFKPLYRDYIDIAHDHGKKIFMHSDGYITDIIPHRIDLGLDALNAQIFCMGVKNLGRFRGKLTFWGEIDRQHLLPEGSTGDIEQAVWLVRESLWDRGGCIAQCEFGPGAKPENVYTVFKTWDSAGPR
jgi:uroporphyrinogen decarboxylase